MGTVYFIFAEPFDVARVHLAHAQPADDVAVGRVTHPTPARPTAVTRAHGQLPPRPLIHPLTPDSRHPTATADARTSTGRPEDSWAGIRSSDPRRMNVRSELRADDLVDEGVLWATQGPKVEDDNACVHPGSS